MKKLLCFAAFTALLCLAFGQAALIRDASPSVSLRFSDSFSAEQASPFAAAWAEENAVVSGQEAVLIRFTGDAMLAFPAKWMYGTQPNDWTPDRCAVSTGLAWTLFGGTDATGLTVEVGAETYTVCGVFDCTEAVLLWPDTAGFTAAELFPAPEETDRYRYAQDCAARAGLPEPEQILCGPEGAFFAGLLPWLFLWLILCRLAGKRKWLLVAALLMLALPDWAFPTRWSDTVFWTELLESLRSRFRDWLTLAPALRDVEVKAAWLYLIAAMAGGLWCFHGLLAEIKSK